MILEPIYDALDLIWAMLLGGLIGTGATMVAMTVAIRADRRDGA
jgi:hypothetical protein